MKPYRKVTPDPPSHRTVTLLIVLLAVLLALNLAHQGLGIG